MRKIVYLLLLVYLGQLAFVFYRRKVPLRTEHWSVGSRVIEANAWHHTLIFTYIPYLGIYELVREEGIQTIYTSGDQKHEKWAEFLPEEPLDELTTFDDHDAYGLRIPHVGVPYVSFQK